MTTTNTKNSGGNARYVILAVLVAAAFFGAYQFAQARTAGSSANAALAPQGAAPAGQSAAAGGSGCACCGSTAPTANGVTGDPVEGTAKLEGNVQKISVDLSQGYYAPNVIKLKAGVPAEITFGESSGCTGQVTSNQLGFFEDLTTGPKTVKLDGLDAGEYQFTCGMQMVSGKIVVE